MFRSLSRQRYRVWRYRRRLLLAVTPPLALSGQAVALAHMNTPVTPDNVWSSWNLDPLIIVPLFLLATLYLSGLRRIWRTAEDRQAVSQRRATAFFTGMLTILIALVSPLDRMSGALFSMHMVQHLLLVVVAAPLLVYSAPLPSILIALPRPWRRKVGRVAGMPAIRAVSHITLNPLVVWWLQAVALWLWHIPALYEAALRSSWWHALEHAMFLSTALLFWWVVMQPHGRRRLGLGLTVIFLFTTMIQSSALGALITFAPSIWCYAHAEYTAAWGISPLGDQQLAGLIMWVPGGLIYFGAALMAFFVWFRSMDRHHAFSASEERVLDSGSGTDRSHSPRSG